MKPNAITNCQNKKGFQSKDEAEDVATRLWLDHEVALEVYHCNLCEGWHFTSGDKK